MVLNMVLGAAYVSDGAFSSLDAKIVELPVLDQGPAIEGWVFPLLTCSSSVVDAVLPSRLELINHVKCQGFPC